MVVQEAQMVTQVEVQVVLAPVEQMDMQEVVQEVEDSVMVLEEQVAMLVVVPEELTDMQEVAQGVVDSVMVLEAPEDILAVDLDQD